MVKEHIHELRLFRRKRLSVSHYELKKWEIHRLREIENGMRRSNVPLIGVPRRDKNATDAIFGEITDSKTQPKDWEKQTKRGNLKKQSENKDTLLP